MSHDAREGAVRGRNGSGTELSLEWADTGACQAHGGLAGALPTSGRSLRSHEQVSMPPHARARRWFWR